MTTGSNIAEARIGQGTTGKSNNYERGLELAESGQHEDALVCIQEHRPPVVPGRAGVDR